MDGFCEKKRLIGGVDDSMRNYVCSCLSAAAKAAAEGQEATTVDRHAPVSVCAPHQLVTSCSAVLLVTRDYRLGLVLPVANIMTSQRTCSPFSSSLFSLKHTHTHNALMALWGLHVLVSTIPEAISVFIFLNGVYSGTLVNKIVTYK